MSFMLWWGPRDKSIPIVGVISLSVMIGDKNTKKCIFILYSYLYIKIIINNIERTNKSHIYIFTNFIKKILWARPKF